MYSLRRINNRSTHGFSTYLCAKHVAHRPSTLNTIIVTKSYGKISLRVLFFDDEPAESRRSFAESVKIDVVTAQRVLSHVILITIDSKHANRSSMLHRFTNITTTFPSSDLSASQQRNAPLVSGEHSFFFYRGVFMSELKHSNAYKPKRTLHVSR